MLKKINKETLKLMAVIGAARYVADEIFQLKGMYKSTRHVGSKLLTNTIAVLDKALSESYNSQTEEFQKDMYPIIDIIEGSLQNNAYIQQLALSDRIKFDAELQQLLSKYGVPTD